MHWLQLTTNDRQLTTVLIRFSQQFPLKQPLVHAMQPFGHCWADQRIVLDVEQVIDDEPYWLVGSHPVLAVESPQVDGNREAPQGTLAPQIHVSIEVTQ